MSCSPKHFIAVYVSHKHSRSDSRGSRVVDYTAKGFSEPLCARHRETNFVQREMVGENAAKHKKEEKHFSKDHDWVKRTAA